MPNRPVKAMAGRIPAIVALIKRRTEMDQKIVGIGIVGALAGMASLEATQPATAGPEPVLRGVQSYADLLDPIPNALATLRAIDAAPVQAASAADGVQVAQYHHHHHHHHHHRVIRRHRHHHHHHHHHHHY
jgi:hypothetical protein